MSILEDSSVYQLIVRKGLEEGCELGRELGLEEGRELGLEIGRQLEAAALVLRQLERLEQLGDALLDFQGQADLAAWLA